ncbi:endonuclease III [Buchananella felis]|uniref:endonuclease III n=1 Tax=Buchananella felis TaxID=3231492 RepID=UPI0035271AE2
METPARRLRPGSKAYVAELLDVLAATHPDAHCELDYRNPFELLVATVLSAQCTDARVNQATPALFAAYPRAADLAVAPLPAVEEIVRPLGFFRRKAEHIVRLSADLEERFGGQVPASLEQLTTLPGVGRKTANVVLGNCFGVPGITVDTHVGRLSRRLGLTRHTDPEKVEADLMRLLPREEWTMTCHRLIFHGRRICSARAPKCGQCPLYGLCPRRDVDKKATAHR